MNKELLLKNKYGKEVKGYIRVLEEENLSEIMNLQNQVMEALENKELYFPSDEEEFLRYINEKGKILGCYTEDNELVAIGVYGALGQEEGNYGYDLGLDKENLDKVGQIESTIVKPSFRGNRLQRILCELLEEIGRENNTPIMTATASPFNSFSVNTFLALGYEIKKDKIKYGGLRRYVLEKRIKGSEENGEYKRS